MPGEKKSPIAIAHEITGCAKCICGAEMELKEKCYWATQTMQAYLKCESCGKHTRVLDFGWGDPIAKIMQEMTKVKKEVNARGNAAMQGL